MKKLWYKLLKTIAPVVIVTGATTSLASCHHKSGPQYNFDDFVKDAQGVTTAQLLNVTFPTGWKDAKMSELKLGEFHPDEAHSIISVTITRTIVGHETNPYIASFENIFGDSPKYDVEDWICSSIPAPIYPHSWDVFKISAKAVLAADLLSTAKPWDNSSKYKWELYGTPAQKVWSETEKAEFDTYGSLTAKDAYKGMQGAPIANDSTKTITAIISKKGKNGAYDSDPIKAVITYKNAQVYKLSDWAFSTDKQLQSINKVKNIITGISESVGLNIRPTFNNNNWMILQDHKTQKVINNDGIDHDPKHNIYNIIDNKYAIDHGPAGQGKIVYAGERAPDLTNPLETKFELVFTFQHWDYAAGKPKTATINMFFNFVYANGKDDSAGGSPFDYTWIAYCITSW